MLRYTNGKPLKDRDLPGDTLEEEEEQETVQYSQVHHSGANGEDNYDDDGEFIHPRSITQESWKRREGVVGRSCISIYYNCVTVVGKS